MSTKAINLSLRICQRTGRRLLVQPFSVMSYIQYDGFKLMNPARIIDKRCFSHNKKMENITPQEQLKKMSENPEMIKMINTPEIINEIKRLAEILISKGYDFKSMDKVNPMMVFKMMNDKEIKEQGIKIQSLIEKHNIKLSPMELMSVLNK